MRLLMRHRSFRSLHRRLAQKQQRMLGLRQQPPLLRRYPQCQLRHRHRHQLRPKLRRQGPDQQLPRRPLDSGYLWRFKRLKSKRTEC